MLIGAVLWRDSGRAQPREVDEVGTIVGRFSQVAFYAVVVIVTSGVIQGWRQVGTYDALFETAYGRLLVFKVLLVAGDAGRRVVQPDLGPQPGRQPAPGPWLSLRVRARWRPRRTRARPACRCCAARSPPRWRWPWPCWP
jgi:hypothetical protein